MSEVASSQPISITNAKRLVRDIKDICKNPLYDEGIYYKHDSENMLKGYAMIIGPSYGLYANGIYFFKFNYPHDYPFSPPVVEYCTNDGTTRFNPNLYRQGKVCLSILNTWEGDSWTSCQTIRTILLQLLLLFHDKPLLNEPGITINHKDFKNYHSIIEYKNIHHSIYSQIKYKRPLLFATLFQDDISKHLHKSMDDILKKCETMASEHSDAIKLYTGVYNMNVTINYPDLLIKLKSLKHEF